MSTQNLKKLSAAGVLITLGIIFGDIGTSPLYVLKSIVGDRPVTEELIYGGLSCVFWTLTLQTTFKYIILTLQADNHGEGGVFSLYALIRRFGKNLYLPAMIGAGTMIADGIITPPISVSSAIEGLETVDPGIPVLPIVLIIITLLFFFQQFGTKVVGSSFGPIMLVWFTMLTILGLREIMVLPGILKALSPHYAFDLLTKYPRGFWLLGAVFLATTGAESLYADLGHCGKKNIQFTWIFVKTALVLNYFGQGAWILSRNKPTLDGLNPFYEMMPHWFIIIGVLIATAATIIASQALISGTFTLINEALSLNFWPRITVKYPTDIRGQIYIPSLNWILWVGCIATILYFRKSSNMEAAYGFSITIAMLMTSYLMSYYLRYIKKYALWIVVLILAIFSMSEISFFIANVAKIEQRWMFLIFEFGIIYTMYVWAKARKVINRFEQFVNLKEQIPLIRDLSADMSIPKFASNLIYLTKANYRHEVEDKVVFSIFSRQPKRADIYWFIHLDRTDEPYTLEYSVDELEDDKIIRVEFRLGFRVQARVSVLFRKVVEEMVANKELNINSRYPSLKKYHLASDFRFVIIEKFLSYENEFHFADSFILRSYFAIKQLAISDTKAFGLDTSDTRIEKTPLVINPVSDLRLKRIHPKWMHKES
ncbi:MAG TPA: potassium transporter Kup [Sphingobacteriaceae bacterium]|nr:potassium transporter Kup [Sphingobacteriaceae bacterium]